jgi:pyruvate decarboxylase
MEDFLRELSRALAPNPFSYEAFKKMYVPPGTPSDDPAAPLLARDLWRQIEGALTPRTSLLVETGDSWFWGLKCKLPHGEKMLPFLFRSDSFFFSL